MYHAMQSELDQLNAYPTLGHISILDHSDDNNYDDASVGYRVQPGDVLVFPDFCTDDLLSDSEVDDFSNWFYSDLLPKIEQLMSSKGYEKVLENDGSASGLYYTLEAYRKVK